MGWLARFTDLVEGVSASRMAADNARDLHKAAEHTVPGEASRALAGEAQTWSGIAASLREMGQ